MKHIWKPSTLLLASAALLVSACGGSRDEPFDPTEPEEEDPDPVATEFWFDGRNPLVEPIGEARRVLVISDVDEFWLWYDEYFVSGNEEINEPNFERGQIVLVEGGLMDECDEHLAIPASDARVSAEQTTDDVVSVDLEYQWVDGIECGQNEESLFRPFSFFYVDSRDTLMIRERLN